MVNKHKPKFCPDENCKCLGCIGDDPTDYEFGKSVECIGKPKSIDIYIAGKREHENDLSHCIWTVRGWNRYFVNVEDLVQCVELFIVAMFQTHNMTPAYLKNYIDRALRQVEEEEM
jgi:hypothetical protein